MWMFMLGLVIGFLLGVTGLRLAWHETYIKKLERVENLAELMVAIRRSENARIQELRQAVDSLRGATVNLSGKRVH